MQVSTGELGSTRRVASSVMDGRLIASPAYYQTQGDDEAQLNSADTWIATKIVPTCDWDLDALSSFVTAVTSAGDQNFFLYEDGVKPEANGDVNSAWVKFHANQSDNSTPLSVGATSEDPGGSHAAYKAFNGGEGSSYWKSADDPATTPQDLEIDLGSGVEKWVNKLFIQAAFEASADDRCYPKTFSVMAKEDGGSSYDTLKVVSSSTDPGENSRIAVTWTATKPYRYFKLTITDSHGAGAFVCVGELEWMEAQNESAPSNTALASLGSVTSGAAADQWTRLAIDQGDRYRFERGRAVWLVCKGSAGADFSLSTGRLSTTAGSGFPDEMAVSKRTVNGGASWSRCLKDERNALWNLILNSTVDHAPRLIYGRAAGSSAYIPNSGLVDIPEEGILLDCSDLIEGAVYSVYAYADGGALALEASTTTRTIVSGIEVKTGEPHKRFLGLISPVEIHAGKAGPIDVTDYRAVANSANQRIKPLGKAPYATATVYMVGTPSWHMRELAAQRGDLSIRVLGIGSSPVKVTCDVRFNMESGGYSFNFAVDDRYRVFDCQPGQYGNINQEGIGFGRFGGTLMVEEGLRDIRPILQAVTGSIVRLCVLGNYEQYLGVNGQILS